MGVIDYVEAATVPLEDDGSDDLLFDVSGFNLEWPCLSSK